MNMNINNNINATLNLTAINKSIASRKNTAYSSDKIENTKNNNIQLSLPTVGRSINSMSKVDSLMKQKDALLERKNEMVNLARESGKDKKTIEKELEAFNEQLQNIDEQIIKATTEELEETAKKTGENISNLKQKTKNELQTENIFNVVAIAENFKQAEVTMSIKNKIEREINTLGSQIKMDGSKSSNRKLEKLSELQTRSNDLISEIGKIQGNINNELSDIIDSTNSIDSTSSNENHSDNTTKESSDKNKFIYKNNKELVEAKKESPITIYKSINYTI